MTREEADKIAKNKLDAAIEASYEIYDEKYYKFITGWLVSEISNIIMNYENKEEA